jgi:hypothetical protein
VLFKGLFGPLNFTICFLIDTQLDRDRHDWYTTANFRFEYNFPDFQDSTASFGFDPRLIARERDN